MTKLGLVSLLAGLLACAPRAAAPPAAETSKQAGSTPVITLERTPCFGRCPVYRVSASSDGIVVYEGKAHVRQLGAASGRINPERVAALLSELERAGYFSFPASFTSADLACGRYATDLPSVITSARVGDRTKRIVHDHGCGSAPGALTVLERRIDQVLDTGRWTGR